MKNGGRTCYLVPLCKGQKDIPSRGIWKMTPSSGRQVRQLTPWEYKLPGQGAAPRAEQRQDFRRPLSLVGSSVLCAHRVSVQRDPPAQACREGPPHTELVSSGQSSIQTDSAV